ncbi:MAG: hypothetical protein WAV08_09935, partial [Desulfobacterales bacterium]
MPSRRAKRLGLALAVVGLALLALALWLGPRSWDQPWMKNRVAAQLSARVGGEVAFDRLAVTFWPRLRVQFSGCRISVPGVGRGDLPQATLYPRLGPFLMGRLQAAEISLLAPEVALQMPAAAPRGRMSGAIRPDRLPAPVPPFDLTIVGGRLELSRGAQRLLQLADLDLQLNTAHGRPHFQLQCRSNLWQRLVAAGQTPSGEKVLRGQAEVTGFASAALLQTLAPAPAAHLQFDPLDLNASFTVDADSGLQARLQSPRLRATVTGTSGQAALAGEDLALSVALKAAGLEIELESLRLTAPAALLSGRLNQSPHPPWLGLALTAHAVNLSAVRQALQDLVGDHPVLRRVLTIVRGGRLSEARWDAAGNTWRELFGWENFRVRAQLVDGRVFVPKPGLDLSDVSGQVSIAQGRLTGSGLQARLGNSSGSGGVLHLGLTDTAETPFGLDLQVAADLSQLPPVLKRIGGPPAYLAELAKLDAVSGRGLGRLKLEKTPAGMTAVVAVAEFDLEADYQRLPARVSLSGGSFFLDSDQIRVAGLDGRMGGTAFQGLSARLGRRPPYALGVTSLAASAALSELFPWLLGFPALQQPLARLTPLSGGVELAAATLSG